MTQKFQDVNDVYTLEVWDDWDTVRDLEVENLLEQVETNRLAFFVKTGIRSRKVALVVETVVNKRDSLPHAVTTKLTIQLLVQVVVPQEKTTTDDAAYAPQRAQIVELKKVLSNFLSLIGANWELFVVFPLQVRIDVCIKEYFPENPQMDVGAQSYGRYSNQLITKLEEVCNCPEVTSMLRSVVS